jgi:acetaldehyde dehydrogenase/alcohol dehydrogenase
MAGMAFANAFLGLCHSMAHKLGGMYHVPHGLANAFLISHIIRFNAVDCVTKQAAFPQYHYPNAKADYANVARYVGITGKNDDELVAGLIAKVEELKAALDIPASMKEWFDAKGITEETFKAQLDELAIKAYDDQCTGANPRYPLISEIKELYLAAYYGR